MKKAITALLICAVIILCGCANQPKIKEQTMQREDGAIIYYPVVQTGNPGVDKVLNSEIKNAVFTKEQGSVNQGYTAVQNKELLSIFIEGATEADSYIKTLHLNTKTGKRYCLYDLIKEDKKQELEKLVLEELNNVLLEYNMVYKPNIESAAFDVFEGRLVLIFNPGEVAPVDMGYIDVVLDFDRIDHIIEKNGELYGIVCQR